MRTSEDPFFENPLHFPHPSPATLSDSATLVIDCAGVCSPADEQPGNFIEKYSLPNGKIIFAIGDTGPRADPLPALCVRHSLRRGLAEKTTDPILAAESMNKLIYDCCAAHCSLSCFYAEFDRETRLLRYVNAGHDSPILIRTNPDEIVHLDEGGPVFGLRESPQFSAGTIKLKTGDRLVAFTQGVIDCLAAQTGGAETALISLTRSRMNVSAFQLAQRIVSECESSHSAKRVEKSVFVACIDHAAAVPPPCRTLAAVVPQSAVQHC
jgi:sigma-B regulation protein RsbU (phosphoserine phosphatase)